MTATFTELDMSVLEPLDFEFEQPCERADCAPNPAMFIVERVIRHEHSAATYFCCLPCWERLGKTSALRCLVCGKITVSGENVRDRALKIIRVIGS